MKMEILRKNLFTGMLLLIVLSIGSCGPRAAAQPQATTIPITLPATWTPTPGPTGIPTATEFPTFTPVPPVPPLPSPTFDSFAALHELFQDSLFSPTGRWTAYRDPGKLRVVSNETTRVWTLPCELFEECSTVFPIKWSRNGQVLYFAPAPTVGGAPKGIMSLTALAMIEVRSGKWEIVLPDSERHYDFGFSPDDDYLAYTQSGGAEADEPSVTLGVINFEDKRERQQFTLEGAYAGNIIWSPFKPRFVFVTYDPENGSAVGYYDIATGFLKYALEAAPRDIIISEWGQDNLVSLELRDWATNAKTNRVLNPFTGELLGD